MTNKIRNLKTTDIIFLVLVAGFFLFLLTAKHEGPEDAKEQVTQQESWLEMTSNDIFDYMDDPEGDLWISNTGVNFMSIYSSPNFSPKKLNSLGNHLVEMDWYELPPQDSYNNEELVAWLGQSLTNTVILCKNKATIIIWMDDLTKKYGNTADIKTIVRLLFDHRTPCFDLESKNN